MSPVTIETRSAPFTHCVAAFIESLGFKFHSYAPFEIGCELAIYRKDSPLGLWQRGFIAHLAIEQNKPWQITPAKPRELALAQEIAHQLSQRFGVDVRIINDGKKHWMSDFAPSYM